MTFGGLDFTSSFPHPTNSVTEQKSATRVAQALNRQSIETHKTICMAALVTGVFVVSVVATGVFDIEIFPTEATTGSNCFQGH